MGGKYSFSYIAKTHFYCPNDDAFLNIYPQLSCIGNQLLIVEGGEFSCKNIM